MKMINDKYDCFNLINKIKKGKTLFFPNDDKLKKMVILQYDIFSKKFRIEFFNPKKKLMEIDLIDEEEAFNKLVDFKDLINTGYILD